ncbi:uncharacterized protein LOC143460612 isoform X2 [Clavelina lepadiformis]|uniref:uncharacterized protein LOC143460612 isoform X2 n=1 Tax=Clavelina lepadiformis TaxID=159417 RepID=UPI0040421DCE
MRIFIFLALLFSIFIITSSSKSKKGAKLAHSRGGFRKTGSSASSDQKSVRMIKKEGTTKTRSRKLGRDTFSLIGWCSTLHKKLHICDRNLITRTYMCGCGELHNFHSKTNKVVYVCIYCRWLTQFCRGKGKIIII